MTPKGRKSVTTLPHVTINMIWIVTDFKVHIFWEGLKISRNLHLTFDSSTHSQKKGEDFAKFCGLLRRYELYLGCLWAGVIRTIWQKFTCMNCYDYQTSLNLFRINRIRIVTIQTDFTLDVSEQVSSEPSSSSSESSSVSDSGPLLQCWTGGGGGAELCFWLGFEQLGGGTLPFLIALAEGFLSFPFPTQ